MERHVKHAIGYVAYSQVHLLTTTVPLVCAGAPIGLDLIPVTEVILTGSRVGVRGGALTALGVQWVAYRDEQHW